MGTKSQSTKGSNKCTNEETFLNKNFNSLIEDPHVNENAEQSMKVFQEACQQVAAKKLDQMRIRGLKLDYLSPDGKERFCRIEALCKSEAGIV